MIDATKRGLLAIEMQTNEEHHLIITGEPLDLKDLLAKGYTHIQFVGHARVRRPCEGVASILPLKHNVPYYALIKREIKP